MNLAAEIKKGLDNLGSALVAKAKRNLKIKRKRQGKNKPYNSNATSSGSLAKSISYDAKVFPSGAAEFRVRMNEYGVTLNDGRPPTKGGGTGSLKDALQNWIVDKKIRPRSKDGKFTGRSFKEADINKNNKLIGMAFVMARSIHKRGYDKAPFFDEAISQTSKEREAMFDIYGSVLDREIDRSFKANGFK